MKVSGLKNVKVIAAVAGGAAVVGLGVFGAVSDVHSGAGESLASGSHMNVGQTSTETTPPTAPQVSMAVPAMRGYTPPSGFAVTH
ncbi:hypothetical protein [Mycolicibacterium peregrinum]|jgi:hypothetical protein|uniref:DUF2613 family protein n=1 Tax=Mycolicibacterium peregrinum TaxID=43304 RepID=A0A1A1ZGU3_MYCPR|nr:hypothetical protein [Mycolicibacterium peregrinum]OBB95806.1 hypothetical protein A5779_17860 [Mycolicibacterium peregrinum]OBF42852.1 hypothetical protein A5719_10455 [Mycolicibacterium peregrinum]